MKIKPIRNVIIAIVWIDRSPHFIRRDDHMTIVVDNSNPDLLTPLITFNKNGKNLFSGNASYKVNDRYKVTHYVIDQPGKYKPS